MSKVRPVPNFKEVKIQCSIYGKYFTTKIFPDKTYKDGNCFGKIGGKTKKFEYWECNKCYNL